MVERRNLFIIVEGTDNVGKSTLINNIKQHFNNYRLHTLHYSNIKQNTSKEVQSYSKILYSEMFGCMEHFIKYEKAGVICDRSHLGELVYGPIYRGYSGEYVLDIESNFNNNLTLWDSLFLITCYDEPENLVYRDDGLSFSTDLDKKTIEINNFKNAHNRSLIKNKLLLNIKDHNAQQASQAVINFIEG